MTSHHLYYSRIYHSAWSSPLGIVLIGSNTAELLHSDGTTSVVFYLQTSFRLNLYLKLMFSKLGSVLVVQ